MSDSDRGAYAPPTDAPLSFDARQPVRGSRPAPLTLIISGVVLLLLLAALVMFYRSGVRQAGQAPETVGAPVGEIRGPAPAEEQPVDPAAGLQIYQSEAGRAPVEPPQFTAPPEAPAARPQPTPIPPPATLAPAKPAAVAPSAGLKPAIAAQSPTTAPKPPAVIKVTPPPAPVAATPKPPAAKPAAPTPAAGATGVASVQIGAFSSNAEADKGWNDAARIAPGATAGKGKKVEPVERNGATLYRTLVTGFGSRAAAVAFCDQLKAAGKSCFVK